MGAYEIGHEAYAASVLEDVDIDASRPEKVFVAHERLVLADDDLRDAVEENRSAAHPSRRAGRRSRAGPAGCDRARGCGRDEPGLSRSESRPRARRHWPRRWPPA